MMLNGGFSDYYFKIEETVFNHAFLTVLKSLSVAGSLYAVAEINDWSFLGHELSQLVFVVGKYYCYINFCQAPLILEEN